MYGKYTRTSKTHPEQAGIDYPSQVVRQGNPAWPVSPIYAGRRDRVKDQGAEASACDKKAAEQS